MDNLKRPDDDEATDAPSLLIQDAHVWTRNGLIIGSISIERGKIKKIARRIIAPGDEKIPAKGLVALPGLIDAHVHLRDMNLSYKEDFTTGTAAAAAGGFTTVLDMPNTRPPTDSARRLREKAHKASRKILVNLGFHVAALDDQKEVKTMKEAGAFSAKLYLPRPIAPLKVDNDETIVDVLKAAKEASLPVTVHAEDVAEIIETPQPQTFTDLARSRQESAETTAVDRILRLQKIVRCKVHFCHITLSSSISKIGDGSTSQLSSEVTPHHLFLSNDALRTVGWKAWMVPPLRPQAETRKLFETMVKGPTTIAATDHAPHTISEKREPPVRSPPGIPGLETAAPLMLTMVSRGKLSLARLVSLLSTNPARVFGLRSKGRLVNGVDGDIVLINLKQRSRIEPHTFFSKAKYSPFEGWRTRGAVDTTIVNGRIVYREKEIVANPGTGRVLKSGKNQ